MAYTIKYQKQAVEDAKRLMTEHRLVYAIHDTEVIVIILTAYGHYDDK